MLEDRYEVEALLIRLVMQRCLLTVGGLGDDYRTSLLKVDTARNRLLFDELTPAPKAGTPAPGRRIRLYGRLDGVEFDFITLIERNALGEDMACFSTRLPDAIRYRQRRAHYRIRIHPRATLCATLRPEAPDAQDADVLDLSLGGIGLMLDGKVNFVPRTRYDCLLHLPEGALLTEVEPRFIRPLPYSDRTRMGVRFTRLSPVARNGLERFIAAFQRELLRQLRGGRIR